MEREGPRTRSWLLSYVNPVWYTRDLSDMHMCSGRLPAAPHPTLRIHFSSFFRASVADCDIVNVRNSYMHCTSTTNLVCSRTNSKMKILHILRSRRHTSNEPGESRR